MDTLSNNMSNKSPELSVSDVSLSAANVVPEEASEEPRVTFELALAHGLTEDEYKRILDILGRVPTYTELGIYSVMWSEHCSYKNSLALLRTMPRQGRFSLAAAGEENAGLVDIGDGLAVAFKVESHNHPSAIEPYQGAATGVGGIMRDVFTMGARPIACLDSLRFGPPADEHTRYLFDGVVRGIADYGNSFGVPTVGGEIYFHPSYSGNPLVNVMAVGVAHRDRIISATAKGAGNSVMIVGSSTGRDGIHGATFASAELTEEAEQKRPSVQVGDPFTEKLLLEAFLEAARTGFIVAAQDMGAAGLTSSSSEMAARGNVGMEIDLDKVPVRESEMSAYEILLSESQERMLLVVQSGHEEEVKRIFEKWDLNAVVIGSIIPENRLRIRFRGKVVADIPVWSLASGKGAPVYTREVLEHPVRTKALTWEAIPEPANYNEALVALISLPDIASKRFVYEQYDTMVRTDTIVGPGNGDAAVLRIKGTRKALAMTIDGNARFVAANPKIGAALAVVEAYRNIISAGAEPLGITDCLNFGNPCDPEVYWQFSEAIKGISLACSALDIPVTGGNVSFYNETLTKAIIPTPVIGMVGLIADVGFLTRRQNLREGDPVYVIGHFSERLYETAWTFSHSFKHLPPPPLPNFDFLLRLKEFLINAFQTNLIVTCHDISDGGFAVALAELCLMQNIGVEVDLACLESPIRTDALLFSEPQANFVLATPAGSASRLEALADQHAIQLTRIGEFGGEKLRIRPVIDIPLALLSERYYFSLPKALSLL
ncbi:MAG: phosphoribosylformylglycinamidine synthase subunit PurL [Bacteroidota bacterium]